MFRPICVDAFSVFMCSLLFAAVDILQSHLLVHIKFFFEKKKTKKKTEGCHDCQSQYMYVYLFSGL